MLTFRILLCSSLLSLVYGGEFDGAWWKSASRARQTGFLDGESDCHQYERKGVERGFRSVYQAADLLDDFYNKSERLGVPVRQALTMINVPSSPKPRGGSAHPEKHGYYDGLWWRGAGPEQGGLGFVEGYLACLPHGRSLYPKDRRVYAALIDKWYQANPAKESAKIAEVLTSFAERPRPDGATKRAPAKE